MQHTTARAYLVNHERKVKWCQKYDSSVLTTNSPRFPRNVCLRSLTYVVIRRDRINPEIAKKTGAWCSTPCVLSSALSWGLAVCCRRYCVSCRFLNLSRGGRAWSPHNFLLQNSWCLDLRYLLISKLESSSKNECSATYKVVVMIELRYDSSQ